LKEAGSEQVKLRVPTEDDFIRLSAEDLRSMSDDDLVEFCEGTLGLPVTDEDLDPRGRYKRGRLLTRALQLAVRVIPE
jgi:hypothetical protein